MLLSCSTNTFGRMPVSLAIDHIGRLGYAGVEILADAPHVWPPVGRRALAGLRRIVSKRKLRVVNVNANTARGVYRERHPAFSEESAFGPSLCDPRESVREERVAHAIRCLGLAADLGAPSVCVTSGRPGTGCPPERADGLFKRSLRTILRKARSLGIKVGIEYEPGLLVESGAETARVLREVGSPWLGVNFDVGHAVVNGEDPAAMIRRLGSSVIHVHVEDIVGRKHYHRVPGEGSVNFRAMFRALRYIGFHGGATVELYPYADAPIPAARRAHRHLSRIMASMGIMN